MKDFHKQAEFLWSFVKSIALCCVISLVLYLAFAILLAEKLSGVQKETKDAVCMVLMQLGYLIALYFFHARHDEYMPPERDAKLALRQYVGAGGWIPAAIYAILAVLTEVLLLLHAQNGTMLPPAALVGIINMPLMGLIPVPVFRTVCALLLTLAAYYGFVLICRMRGEEQPTNWRLFASLHKWNRK